MGEAKVMFLREMGECRGLSSLLIVSIMPARVMQEQLCFLKDKEQVISILARML